MTAPLDGLRVIDLSRTLPGALATHFLSDNGADVVQVEPPGGSPVRHLPGYPILGRGKRSMVLDLGDNGAPRRLRDLLADADILVETFRPRVGDTLGLGADTLTRAHPRLVHLSITG